MATSYTSRLCDLEILYIGYSVACKPVQSVMFLSPAHTTNPWACSGIPVECCEFRTFPDRFRRSARCGGSLAGGRRALLLGAAGLRVGIAACRTSSGTGAVLAWPVGDLRPVDDGGRSYITTSSSIPDHGHQDPGRWPWSRRPPRWLRCLREGDGDGAGRRRLVAALLKATFVWMSCARHCIGFLKSPIPCFPPPRRRGWHRCPRGAHRRTGGSRPQPLFVPKGFVHACGDLASSWASRWI